VKWLSQTGFVTGAKFIFIFIYSYKILKQELKTVKVNSEKHTQVYGMYRAV